MGDASRPNWHWDEQAALRAELAEQAEAAAADVAALQAEVARLEEAIAFWQTYARAAGQRERKLRASLVRAIRRVRS